MSSLRNHRVGLLHGIAVSVLLCFGAGASAAGSSRPLLAPDFVEAAPQGFGDRQNSEAMSMLWWKGYLFVGTNRANSCVQQASISFYRPDLGGYPPTEADLECTPLPQDLPLQAEILAVDAGHQPMGPRVPITAGRPHPGFPRQVRGERHRFPRHGDLPRGRRHGGDVRLRRHRTELQPARPPSAANPADH